jgi:hypothetical protein
MTEHQPAHRFAVAFGAVAALAPLAWQVWAFAFGERDPLLGGATQALLLVSVLPILLLRVLAVALAVRSGWQRTAGLVLLVVLGLFALGGAHTAVLVLMFPGDPAVLLVLVGVVAAIVAGVAAFLALRGAAGGPLPQPLLGPVESRGWRLAAAAAAALLATSLVAQGLAALRNDVPEGALFAVGSLVAAVVLGIVALGALRVEDGRVLALVLAVPGAEGFLEGVGALVQLAQGSLYGVPTSTAQTAVGVALTCAGLALAVTAAALWREHRPLATTAPRAPTRV